MVSKKQKNGNYVKILEFLSYVSNIPVANDYLADLYKRRSVIETQYSTVHRFQGKTCSKNENVRIFIFILGFVLLCLWLFLNAILNEIYSLMIFMRI